MLELAFHSSEENRRGWRHMHIEVRIYKTLPILIRATLTWQVGWWNDNSILDNLLPYKPSPGFKVCLRVHWKIRSLRTHSTCLGKSLEINLSVLLSHVMTYQIELAFGLCVSGIALLKGIPETAIIVYSGFQCWEWKSICIDWFAIW